MQHDNCKQPPRTHVTQPSWNVTVEPGRYIPAAQHNTADGFRERQHQRMRAARWDIPQGVRHA